MFTLIYMLIGLIVAFATARLFPPTRDYAPPIHVVLLALVTFTAAWPVVVLMLARYCQIEEPARNVVRQRVDGVAATSQQIQL